MRSGRDADRPGRADVVVNRLELQIVVEHLDAAVAAVADIDVALGVRRRWCAAGSVVPGADPSGPDGLDEAAVLVVLHDARIAVAVGDEDIARRRPTPHPSGG